ncbi:hypothetical protein Geob_3676 [Geotalea daltonii FRC-32]|uniref:Transmembrane protein n=1 Tax=Geotalea daltonii (strain DSM 22248 / JCM 15807 / FRC-32) TaxID=316067 RepID=B9M6Z4_GEODF|nr:hypothetical protein [Geotalea daltonii]ACM22015.1 hypothetical protein Geob_3676 [Geotalea daltonii FRC-32]
MGNQAEVLEYSERGFGAKAKRLLNENKDFDVSICGWRARVILSSLQLLMHMQEGERKKQGNKLGTFYTLSRFAVLMPLSSFMAIFWLAVANNRGIRLKNSSNDSVVLEFRGK